MIEPYVAKHVRSALLVCACFAALAFSIWMLSPILSQSRIEFMSLDCNDFESVGTSPFPSVDWEKLKETNKDVIGWVSIPDTHMSMPIVQASTDDPTRYLTHDFFGNANAEGCAFLDAECIEAGLLSRNSVVFGHHLIGNRGFSPFADYSDESFARSHPTVLLQTPDWCKSLTVVFVEVTRGNARSKVTSFENDDQFRLWLKSRIDASCVKLVDCEELRPSNIWTFCTCSYSKFADERTLVYAIENG